MVKISLRIISPRLGTVVVTVVVLLGRCDVIVGVKRENRLAPNSLYFFISESKYIQIEERLLLLLILYADLRIATVYIIQKRIIGLLAFYVLKYIHYSLFYHIPERVLNIIFGCILQCFLLLWERRRGSRYPEREGDYGLKSDGGVHGSDIQ